jgi:hypothetical protein
MTKERYYKRRKMGYETKNRGEEILTSIIPLQKKYFDNKHRKDIIRLIKRYKLNLPIAKLYKMCEEKFKEKNRIEKEDINHLIKIIRREQNINEIIEK